MTSTILFLGSIILLSVVATLAWAVLLRLGLRWAQVPGVNMRRTAIVAVLVWGIQLALSVVGIAAIYFLEMTVVAIFVAWAVLFAIYGGGSWGIIARAFQTSYSKAARAWLPTLLAPLVVYPFSLFVYRPFIYEGYLIPTNSMAPTVVGEHVAGKCPQCGAASYGWESQVNFQRVGPARMICDHFHTFDSSEYDKTLREPSRIVASKLLKPRRWDLVVFRYPDDDSQNYLKRLIGLPGETVTIVDGSIYINGARIEPPDELREINYVTEFPKERSLRGVSVWGSAAKPAVLGPDEYFVLGDNTTAALDSRLWELGAPGHPPYAVPESYMIGTATHIYWPPERIRVLR